MRRDTLEVDFVDVTDEGTHREAILRINGRDLIDIVREIEQPFADAEGHPDIAGAYASVGAALVRSGHLLHNPDPLGRSDDGTKVAVLFCECHDWYCWPLYARIDLRDDVVVWRDFEQRHRPAGGERPEWSYTGLGPFVFDRVAYEAALSAAELRPDRPADV